MKPDLIIEVTRSCNRTCNGCYASNTIVSEQFSQEKGINLSAKTLDKALCTMAEQLTKAKIVFLRGGEPFTNPELAQIIQIVSSHKILTVIETNGDFILRSPDVIRSIALAKGIIKISFDKMHNSNPRILKTQLLHLKKYNVNYVIAITAITLEKFNVIAASIPFVPAEKLMFQTFSVSGEGLIEPKLGVLNLQAKIKKGVSTKWESIA